MSTHSREDAEEQDGFARGYHGIPLEAELQAMPYLDLCELLASCEKGTTKHSILEREKVRRDIIENTRLARSGQTVWDHPAAKGILSIIVGVVCAALIYFLGFK